MRQFRWTTMWVLTAGYVAACTHRPDVHANLSHELAEVLVAHGAYEPAVPLLQEAIAKDPNNARTRTMLGMVLREHRLFAEARQELARAWQLDDQDPDTAAAFGLLMDMQAQGEDADLWHRRAIALSGGRAEHYNNLGFSLYLRGQLTDAIEAYRRALTKDPGMRRAFNNLGFAQARLGQLGAAWESFLQGGPRPRALSNLGLAYEMAGDVRGARAYYEEALSADATLKVARKNLDNLLQPTKDPLP